MLPYRILSKGLLGGISLPNSREMLGSGASFCETLSPKP